MTAHTPKLDAMQPLTPEELRRYELDWECRTMMGRGSAAHTREGRLLATIRQMMEVRE